MVWILREAPRRIMPNFSTLLEVKKRPGSVIADLGRRPLRNIPINKAITEAPIK